MSISSIWHRVWALVFAVWAVFLSGVLSDAVGSPGIIQALRLKRLLDSKLEQVRQAEQTIESLQTESALLEKSSLAQEREIRKTLGYAAPDEIVFEF